MLVLSIYTLHNTSSRSSSARCGRQAIGIIDERCAAVMMSGQLLGF
jgi:hypothetical protein